MSFSPKWTQSVLVDNKEVLLKNISVSDNLIKRLKDIDLLSDSMTNDLKTLQNSNATNFQLASALLGFVGTRVAYLGNFELFCDALEFCGHQILAVFLRSEVQELATTKSSSTHSGRLGLQSSSSLQQTTDKPAPEIHKISKKRPDMTVAYARAVAAMQSDSGFFKPEETDLVLTVRKLKHQLNEMTEKSKELEEALTNEQTRYEDLLVHHKMLRQDLNITKDKSNVFVQQQSRAAEARQNQIMRLEDRATRQEDLVNIMTKTIASALYQHQDVQPIVLLNNNDNVSNDLTNTNERSALSLQPRGSALFDDSENLVNNIGDPDDDFEGVDPRVSSLEILASKINEIIVKYEEVLTDRNSIIQKVEDERQDIVGILGSKEENLSSVVAVRRFVEAVDAEKLDDQRRTRLLVDCLTEDSPKRVDTWSLTAPEMWDLILTSLTELKKHLEDKDIRLNVLQSQLTAVLKEQAKLRQNTASSLTQRSLEFAKCSLQNRVILPTSGQHTASNTAQSPKESPKQSASSSATNNQKKLAISASVVNVTPSRLSSNRRYGTLQPIANELNTHVQLMTPAISRSLKQTLHSNSVPHASPRTKLERFLKN